ncbi:hypothetical protein BJX66DRAFT_310681 [Aspergillus keveii]|uniref:Uncharacterized protein n=1 Tax=Aspergillus keveii TaxID=714993 RepID=A0ABR4FWF4_9EURO
MSTKGTPSDTTEKPLWPPGRRSPSPTNRYIPPKEEESDIGLFLGIGHDTGYYGRDWILLMMNPGNTRCEYYHSGITHETPLDTSNPELEITNDYPYAKFRLENMSADVEDLARDFQGWTAVGTMGEEHWDRFFSTWLATKPGPSQWFMGRFLDALARESLIEQREVDEIFSCTVYSDYEADIWGGDAGFPVDREWMEAAQREEEEIQRVEDERLIDEMNDEMNSEFEKEGA